MGRKGVSKRKPGQTRSKPMSSGITKRISSVRQADENQPTVSGKDVPNLVSDWKKKPSKGLSQS